MFLYSGNSFFSSSDINPKPQEVHAQTTSTDWPQLQHDAQHTGRTQVSVPPNYEVAWAWAGTNHVVKNFASLSGKSITDGFGSNFVFSTIFSQQVQPIIAEGKVYVGSMNGHLYAIDALSGDTKWDFPTGGPILSTAAYGNGVVVIGSMDGNVYGISVATGVMKWKITTGAGISASPVVFGSTVYLGSRDGIVYAIDISSGALRWKYETRDPAGQFSKAPIVAPAAVSEDGQTVIVGAENMYLYGLNAFNGTEKWSPKKLVGQSFLYSWPVISQGKVVVRTMSSLTGAEHGLVSPDIESTLAALPPEPTAAEEKSAILSYLQQNPHQKSMYVFDIATGIEPFQIAMGRVTGNNYTAHLPILDNQGRLLTYWRSKRAYFFQDGPAFGTKYCPDLGPVDLSTGDRIRLRTTFGTIGICPELDNGFQITSGGDYLYFANSFRGTFTIHQPTYKLSRMTAPIARWDCADFRLWGYSVVYYGNDSVTQNCPSPADPRPPKQYQEGVGFAGIAIATNDGIPMLYVNEPDAGFIVALRKKP